MSYLFWGWLGTATVLSMYLSFVKSIAIYRKRLDLPIKKLPPLWEQLNEDLTSAGPEWIGVIAFASLWPLHFLIVGVFIGWKNLIKRFALSKEERISVALGTHKSEENITREPNW